MTAPRTSPICLSMKLNRKEVPMEVDTGASFSVMSKATYQKVWTEDRPPLLPTTTKLKTYTGEQLNVLGYIQVQVQYEQQIEDLSLLIVDGTGPTLMGRDWLQKIKLQWNAIANIAAASTLTLEQVLEKHPSLFKDDLGLVQGVTAKLHIDPQVTPKFHKARPVPYALRSKIELELKWLEENGIIERVEFAE